MVWDLRRRKLKIIMDELGVKNVPFINIASTNTLHNCFQLYDTLNKEFPLCIA